MHHVSCNNFGAQVKDIVSASETLPDCQQQKPKYKQQHTQKKKGHSNCAAETPGGAAVALACTSTATAKIKSKTVKAKQDEEEKEEGVESDERFRATGNPVAN